MFNLHGIKATTKIWQQLGDTSSYEAVDRVGAGTRE